MSQESFAPFCGTSTDANETKRRQLYFLTCEIVAVFCENFKKYPQQLDILCMYCAYLKIQLSQIIHLFNFCNLYPRVVAVYLLVISRVCLQNPIQTVGINTVVTMYVVD